MNSQDGRLQQVISHNVYDYENLNDHDYENLNDHDYENKTKLPRVGGIGGSKHGFLG